LHDVIEDTARTIEEIREVFGPVVAELVEACSERKLDEEGRERPWAVRKREKLDGLARASIDARGVGLADKLHNLRSIEADLGEGEGLWGKFKATPTEVLARYGEAVETWGHGDARLERLAAECRETLRRIEAKLAAAPGSHVGVDRGGVR
jgi:(p)ppGpp synthase/HD superfamily hydrolase